MLKSSAKWLKRRVGKLIGRAGLPGRASFAANPLPPGGKEVAFFSLEGKHRRLVENLAKVRSASGAKYVAPPATIPDSLLSEFTMDGRAAVFDWYINSKPDPKSIGSLQMYSHAMISQVRQDVAARKYKSYGITNDYLREALAKYPIKGKYTLIIGSVYPQYECFCLNAGARPVTIEYNVRFSDCDELTFFSPDQFEQLGVKGEAAISISSYEHDGLGRYGDPIDPNADLKSMRNLQKSLEPGSFAFVSVPLGRDGISWNAHRVYGHLRLPMLLEGWEVVDCIGDERALAGVRDGRLGIDPGRWDAHFPPAKNGPEWVFVLRRP